MRDIVENFEAMAEERYYRMLQPDGKLKCECGRCFNPMDEGAILTGNPYDMPICGECFLLNAKESTEKER